MEDMEQALYSECSEINMFRCQTGRINEDKGVMSNNYFQSYIRKIKTHTVSVKLYKFEAFVQ
jgi:hypothetical protein